MKITDIQTQHICLGLCGLTLISAMLRPAPPVKADRPNEDLRAYKDLALTGIKSAQGVNVCISFNCGGTRSAPPATPNGYETAGFKQTVVCVDQLGQVVQCPASF